MDLEEDRSGQTQHPGFVGEDAATLVRCLISMFTRSSGFIDHTFFQWAIGKAVKAQMSVAASRGVSSTAGNWRPSLPAMASS